MPSNQPLLTIAIPTYNRSRFLAELLENLKPQLAHETRVELIVSNNASTDQTAQVIASFQAQGMTIAYLCNTKNIGPDANFLQCMNAAAGKYVWIFGDDDLLTRDAIRQLLSLLEQGEEIGEFDLVYLSSFGFTGDYRMPAKRVVEDRLGRFAEVVTDGRYFVEKVNALLVTISANIVNKNRLVVLPHPPLDHLQETYLPQLAWIFPLIQTECRVLYVWERLMAYRDLNSGGWNFWELFGVRLNGIVREYFYKDQALGNALMNGVVRYYMSDTAMRFREHNPGRDGTKIIEALKPIFRRNWRFWVFVYPVAAFPLWLARPLHRSLFLTNRITRATQAIFRHLLVPTCLLSPVPVSPGLSSGSGSTSSGSSVNSTA